MAEDSWTRAEEDLLRNLTAALRAPAMEAELRGEDAAAVAFRAAQAVDRPLPAGAARLPRQRRRLHLVASMPATAALAGALVLPAGAVAAAYTGHLPAPLQRWAHAALGPIGVPSRHGSAPSGLAALRPSTTVPHPEPEFTHGRAPAARPELERRHARVVQLCGDLGRASGVHQAQILTQLHDLLPVDVRPVEACRQLTLAARRPAPKATPAPASHATPTRTPAPAPSGHSGPGPSGVPAPTTSATGTPHASPTTSPQPRRS